MGKLTAILMLVVSTHAFAGGLFDGATPISRAHQAFLARDFRKMALELKSALEAEPENPALEANALALLRKSNQEIGIEGVPVDWKVPEEIDRLRIGVARSSSETVRYSIKISGDAKDPSQLITQLQLKRHPDEVVLDRQAGIGEWWMNPKEPGYFELKQKQNGPIPGGLYLLYLELSNGKRVNGWFILDDEMNATTAPRVLSPEYGQVFTTANPMFRWEDYRSPQYQGEPRAVHAHVSRNEPPSYDWEEQWSFYENPAVSTEATLGQFPGDDGVDRLSPGRFVVSIAYTEKSRFGDLVLMRTSATIRPFIVK